MPANAMAMASKASTPDSEVSAPQENCYRLVVVGSPKVGKTAIVSRFLNGKFDDQYTPTIEDFHRKIYKIKGHVYQLDILDTSGNNPFPAIKKLSILTGEFLHLTTQLIFSWRFYILKLSARSQKVFNFEVISVRL